MNGLKASALQRLLTIGSRGGARGESANPGTPPGCQASDGLGFGLLVKDSSGYLFGDPLYCTVVVGPSWLCERARFQALGVPPLKTPKATAKAECSEASVASALSLCLQASFRSRFFGLPRSADGSNPMTHTHPPAHLPEEAGLLAAHWPAWLSSLSGFICKIEMS